MTEHFHILDAFMDGEPVDPAALRRALADAGGRDYLVDAWLLRNLVQEEMLDDVAVAPARIAMPLRRQWLAAAAVAGISLAGGYLIGTTGSTGTAVTAGTAGAPVAVATADVQKTGGVMAPPATRVIRLELDPNWKETAGGR